MSLSYDVAVIGAGYAGLMAAYAAQQSGRNTLLIAKGHGGTHLRTGCIDVLGYVDNQRVDRPLAAVSELATTQPTHPYAVLGAEAVLPEHRQAGAHVLEGQPAAVCRQEGPRTHGRVPAIRPVR